MKWAILHVKVCISTVNGIESVCVSVWWMAVRARFIVRISTLSVHHLIVVMINTVRTMGHKSIENREKIITKLYMRDCIKWNQIDTEKHLNSRYETEANTNTRSKFYNNQRSSPIDLSANKFSIFFLVNKWTCDFKQKQFQSEKNRFSPTFSILWVRVTYWMDLDIEEHRHGLIRFESKFQNSIFSLQREKIK